MKESPILFKPWKVRKILGWDWSAGDMQTRRIIEPQPFKWASIILPAPVKFGDVDYGKAGDWIQISKEADNVLGLGKCRYGVPGDLLWVKETWTLGDSGYLYKATHLENEAHPRWKSSLYMPKAAARIWLQVVDVRAEQVQDITPEDVLAEGIEKTNVDAYWLAPLAGTPDFPWARADMAYASVWNEINPESGQNWESNPWVWVVTYTIHKRSPL